MTLLKDLIEIPEHSSADDFVVKLTDARTRVVSTLNEYVPTRAVVERMNTALREACSAGQHPGAICVVPADPAAQTVVLDGMQFPEFDSSRIFQLPSAWLRGDAA